MKLKTYLLSQLTFIKYFTILYGRKIMLHLTEAINWPTFVLSIVSSGGILGLFGFILHLKEYYSKKPKIICKKDDIYDSYWEHGETVK